MKPMRPAGFLVVLALVLLQVVAAHSQPAASVGENDLSGLPLEHFHAIVERPLFSPTRRAPASLAVDGEGSARQFELKGVIVSAREQHALIVSQATGKSYEVRTGDIVEGWRVERITEQSAAFTKGGVETLVPLKPPPATP
jgi:general secretion pathway protein N